MPKNLCHSLDQLAFMQTKHKARHASKPLDSYKRGLYHFLLSRPQYTGYVIQVDDYGQGKIA